MSDLVEFLKARLDEDEGFARERLDDKVSQYGQAELDPEHALRVVEAMRRIMARHSLDLTSNWAGGDQELCAGCGCDWGGGIMPLDECPELRDLASVYANHEDYRAGRVV